MRIMKNSQRPLSDKLYCGKLVGLIMRKTTITSHISVHIMQCIYSIFIAHLKQTFFDIVHVVSIGKRSSATMVNVLTTPLYKAVLRSRLLLYARPAVEILDTITGVYYSKLLRLGEQLLR